jgi:hypothetical protein
MSDVFRHIGSDSDRRADLARTCKVPKAVLRRSVDHLVGDSHVSLKGPMFGARCNIKQSVFVQQRQRAQQMMQTIC